MYVFLAYYMLSPSWPPRLPHPIIIVLGDLYKSWNSLCTSNNQNYSLHLAHSQIFFLCTLFSDTCNLNSSLKVDHISHPYKITEFFIYWPFAVWKLERMVIVFEMNNKYFQNFYSSNLIHEPHLFVFTGTWILKHSQNDVLHSLLACRRIPILFFTVFTFLHSLLICHHEQVCDLGHAIPTLPDSHKLSQ